ncbi:MAG: nuclear transport factor 2 family protein [Planctomycetes bacterium]|nr:nuclear transport factor 2 family protein [Planctomycetota bacterium]NOG53724.1 nuclear transport factor 2 family protein [Planctomycetota bacterium]
MSRTLLSLAAVLTAGIATATFQPQEQPPNHPQVPDQAPTTMPQQKEMPVAQPEDVESIDAIMSAYYNLEDGERGQERNWDRVRSLYHPDARLMAARPNSKGGCDAFVFSVDDYLKSEQKYLERGGYFADELFRTVEQYGNVAQVFSTYESRRSAQDEKPYSRGINSFQLVNDGERWWIMSILWDFERGTNPIPEKYLGDG